MWEEHENFYGGGRFRRAMRSGGLLCYWIEGDAGERTPLAGELLQALKRDVLHFSPTSFIFELTLVENFYGSPIGFLMYARRVASSAGGSVSVVLGPGHAPCVRNILTLCRVIAGPESSGLLPCYDSVEAAEDAVTAKEQPRSSTCKTF